MRRNGELIGEKRLARQCQGLGCECRVAVSIGEAEQLIGARERYALVLLAMMVVIVAAGAVLGELIRNLVPGSGLVHFVAECAIWLAAIAIPAAPLLRTQFRERLLSALAPM